MRVKAFFNCIFNLIFYSLHFGNSISESSPSPPSALSGPKLIILKSLPVLIYVKYFPHGSFGNFSKYGEPE